MYYILKDRTPIPCEGITELSEWYKLPARFLRKDKVDNYIVSTIFLGIDMNHKNEGEPVLFETLVTTDRLENQIEIDRYCTWDEAMIGHHRLLDKYTNLPNSVG